MAGRRPFPVLTAVVCAVTATVSVAGPLVPGVLLGLRRDAALVSAGQVWRPVTAGGSLGAPLVTVVLCAAVVPLVRAGRSGSAAAPGWVALGTTVVVAAVLLVRADIHGAALAAGLLIARPASGGTVAVPDPSVLP